MTPIRWGRVGWTTFWLVACIPVFIAIYDGFDSCCYGSNPHRQEYCTVDGVVRLIAVRVADFVESHDKIIIAIATVVIAWFTATLWRSTDQLSRAATQQRIDTAKALAIAGKSAEIAEKTLISAHRPWLVIEKVSPRGIRNRGQQSLTFDIVVRNVGNSPAINVSDSSEQIIGKDAFPSIEETKAATRRLAPKDPMPGITIVPGGVHTIETGWSLFELEHPPNAHFIGFLVCCVYYTFPFIAEEQKGVFAAVYRVTDTTPEDRTNILVEFDWRYGHAE